MNMQIRKQKCLSMKETIIIDIRIYQVKIVFKNKKNPINFISH